MQVGYIYIREHESYDIYDCCKLGKASNIPERDSQYATGEIKRGKFVNVFEVNKSLMDLIEKNIQNEFKDLNIYIDGGTEFYKKEIKVKIKNYLLSNNIIYRELSVNEIKELVRIKRIKDTTNIDKVPYDYQLQIINKTKDYFKFNNKGLLVLICGVGKTLISSWITKELGHKKIVIGVPNTVLLEQWENEIKFIFPDYKLLKVQGGVNTIDIKKFIKKNDLVVVITTYASSYKIRSVNDYNFDMKICDEVHHLTTSNMDLDEITKNFVEFLKIKSNKQISLTATLKYLENSDPNKNTVSNENIEYFGEIIERKSLLWAINKNIVCDYQIQMILSDKLELEKYLDELEIETDSDARLFLSAYASLQSINLGKSHHLLIYSNNKENSIKIIGFIEQLIEKEFFDFDDLFYSEYHSELNEKEQIDILDNYNKSKKGIISCVYCLGEGYDNKLIDGVVFSENMSSNIRIVQSSLRGSRINKNEKSKIAKIILPILHKDNWFDDNDNEDLKKIREVIYQIGLEDKTIEHKIKVYKVPIQKNINNNLIQFDDAEIGEYNDELTKKVLLKSLDRLRLGLTYEKAVLIIKKYKITTKEEYFRLCENDIRLPKEPKEYFKDQFTNWIDYLSIHRIYYNINQCKEKVKEYLKNNIKISNIFDNDKICEELCKLDINFPPNGLWVEYYQNDKISSLDDIIKNNTNKKKKYSSLI